MKRQNAFPNGGNRAFEHPLSLCVLVVLCWTLVSPGATAVEDSPEPSVSPLRLTVTLCDHYKLLPHGFDSMAKEVRGIFNEIGVETELRRFSEEKSELEPEGLPILVTLMPNMASDWGASKRITAVSLVKGGRGSVYIFMPKLFDTLGWSWSPNRTRSSRQNVELARALGRVVSHELVHAIAPEAPHTETGLMCAWLNRKSLLRGRLRMSSSTAEHVLNSMRMTATSPSMDVTHQAAGTP
jgi:hypothetical protein